MKFFYSIFTERGKRKAKIETVGTFELNRPGTDEEQIKNFITATQNISDIQLEEKANSNGPIISNELSTRSEQTGIRRTR